METQKELLAADALEENQAIDLSQSGVLGFFTQLGSKLTIEHQEDPENNSRINFTLSFSRSNLPENFQKNLDQALFDALFGSEVEKVDILEFGRLLKLGAKVENLESFNEKEETLLQQAVLLNMRIVTQFLAEVIINDEEGIDVLKEALDLSIGEQKNLALKQLLSVLKEQEGFEEFRRTDLGKDLLRSAVEQNSLGALNALIGARNETPYERSFLLEMSRFARECGFQKITARLMSLGQYYQVKTLDIKYGKIGDPRYTQLDGYKIHRKLYRELMPIVQAAEDGSNVMLANLGFVFRPPAFQEKKKHSLFLKSFRLQQEGMSTGARVPRSDNKAHYDFLSKYLYFLEEKEYLEDRFQPVYKHSEFALIAYLEDYLNATEYYVESFVAHMSSKYGIKPSEFKSIKIYSLVLDIASLYDLCEFCRQGLHHLQNPNSDFMQAMAAELSKYFDINLDKFRLLIRYSSQKEATNEIREVKQLERRPFNLKNTWEKEPASIIGMRFDEPTYYPFFTSRAKNTSMNCENNPRSLKRLRPQDLEEIEQEAKRRCLEEEKSVTSQP